MPITYEFSEITSCNMCGSSDFKRIGNRLNKTQGLNPKKKFEYQLLFFVVKIADLFFKPPCDTYWYCRSLRCSSWRILAFDYFKTDDGFLERNRVWLKRYFSDTKGLKSLDIVPEWVKWCSPWKPWVLIRTVLSRLKHFVKWPKVRTTYSMRN